MTSPQWSTVLTFSAVLDPKNILFTWDFPKDGLAALLADGQSTVHGSVVGIPGNLSWSFDGDNLGCALAGDNTGVMVTAGTNTGTIMVKATIGGVTCYKLPLDLVECPADCAGCPNNGGFSVNNSSVDVKIGLGSALLGTTAGYLHIKEASPTNTLCTPKGLHYDFRRPEVSTFTNAQWMFQLQAPQVFVNIITNSATKYSIQLWNPANVGAWTNGGYNLLNTPYRTITVESPGGNTNEVLLTDSNDGSTYDYTWQGTGWLLDTDSGLRKELRTNSTSGNITVVTTTISTGSASPVFSKIETNQTSASYSGQRLVGEVLGAGSAARTNTYFYTTNGYLQQVMRWDGTWEYYVYDTNNRPLQIFSGFQNQSVTTNRTLCRLVENSYSSSVISGSGDNVTTYFNTPRQTVEYVNNVEVARKYFVALPGQRLEIHCAVSGAAWNDSQNLVTTYNLFTSTFHLNEPQVVIRPDGTADVYQYGPVGDTTTNVVLTGHLDGTGLNIDAGTATTLILGPTGLLLSKTVADVQSTITVDREMYTYDDLNRLTNTTYLDGTSSQITYDCCTISARKDRDGTVTSYTHDALKRTLTTTLNGITISNIYDPSGNILGIVRFGTNNTSMTISQATFDNSGLQTSSTNALGQPTTFSYHFDGAGQLVKQTAFADTGTRIETYYQDGSIQSVTGSAAFPARYEYGADGGGAYTKEIKLDAGGSDTSEWTKTYKDTLGRQYKTVYASASGSPSSVSYFNTLGQLTNQLDPDGVSTLYTYNLKGEPACTILDSNRDYTIDWAGGDRITFVTNDVVFDNSTYVRRTRTYAWTTSANASNLILTAEISVDGLHSWNTIWNNGTPVTERTDTFYDPANGRRYVTNTAPDGSFNVSTYVSNQLASVVKKDANGTQLGQTSYGYDAHGRQKFVTDARAGTTTNFFNNADQISSVVTTSPDGNQPGQNTTNLFDNMGQVWKVTLPDSTSVTNEFYLTGLPKRTYGSRIYPVAYTYDAQGRMKTMTNWTSFTTGAGSRVTSWNYDTNRGWLSSKIYDGGTAAPTYAYTAAGRLQARLWARGTNTTYSYNNAGEVAGTAYNDGVTHSVAYNYDRRGRQTTVTNGLAVCSLAYDDAGNLLSEAYSGGPLDGLFITNAYDTLLRRTTNGLVSGSTLLAQNRYTYDAASRLASVSDSTNSATYAYLANSPLIDHILFTNSATLRMSTTNRFDNLNRLLSVSSSQSAAPAVTFSYPYNTANQRIGATNADSSYWVYAYDRLGQVTSGKKFWSDGTPVAGQQFDYVFDDIANRTWTTNNSRLARYLANNLNQYTNRDVAAYVNMLGSANSNATVTLWRADGSYATTTRKGQYYRGEFPVNNSTGALWLTLTNLGVVQDGANPDIISTITANTFVSKTPELFSYDADGNLASDGRWTYTWDAENRLVSMVSLSNAPAASKLKLDFAYDYRGRRIQKIVSAWNGSAYASQSTNRFASDGWNLLAELGSTNGVLRAYLWGLDLSGTIQGAGGVGGLLFVKDASLGAHFAACDGNGNVVSLTKASDGTSSATYEYGPFGEVLRATGPMAKANPFRFSTKYQDDETDLLYYGYRYYNASTGRWLSRDAAGEDGSANLYAFGFNCPVTYVDDVGLEPRNTVEIDLLGLHYRYEGPDTGYTLGLDWVLGIARDRQYGPDDHLTKQLRDSRVMEIDRNKARSLLRHFCRTPGAEAPWNIPIGGELSQIPPLEYALWQFPKDLLTNPGAAFIGSITSGTIDVSSINCCKCEAKIQVHAVNVSGTASATHKKPKNRHYAEGPNSSLLPDDIFGRKGPMHTFKQTFDWDETLSFGPCGL
jgi:RHS repeat-associated protein